MIILRQRVYAEQDQEDEGIGWGKIAAGTAAVGALGVGLGRRGYLGASAMKAVNKGWAKVGNVIGSGHMVKSGTRGVAAADMMEKGIVNRKGANALRNGTFGKSYVQDTLDTNAKNRVTEVIDGKAKNVYKEGTSKQTVDWKGEKSKELNDKYGLQDGTDARDIMKQHRQSTRNVVGENEGYQQSLNNMNYDAWKSNIGDKGRTAEQIKEQEARMKQLFNIKD